ncbi:MAG: hypothetical protein QNJ51_24905 [Calothrix sp. MO_167.B12]|nr:hypothetical protein [Calothrix sp. MO_167.B12]
MSGDMFKKLVEKRQKSQPDTPPAELPVTPAPPPPEPKKRGRPATGKRSDPNWTGRTYYIRKETDLDVEGELLQLKRQGIELDKSELVDALLDAWVKWRQGDNIDLRISEISPRRKDDKAE